MSNIAKSRKRNETFAGLCNHVDSYLLQPSEVSGLWLLIVAICHTHGTCTLKALFLQSQSIVIFRMHFKVDVGTYLLLNLSKQRRTLVVSRGFRIYLYQ